MKTMQIIRKLFVLSIIYLLSGVLHAGDGSSENSPVEWGFFRIISNDVYKPLENLSNVNWSRITRMLWSELELPPGSGNYNWEFMDGLVKDAQEDGYNLVFELKTGVGIQFSEINCLLNAIIQCSSQCLKSQSCPIKPDYDIYWQELVYNIVERYDGDGKSDMPDLSNSFRLDIQIENEAGNPANWAFDEREDGMRAAEEYIHLLKISYEAKNKANQATNIILTGITDPVFLARCDEMPDESYCTTEFHMRNRDFTSEILKYPQYFDVVDVHLFLYFKFDHSYIADSLNWVKEQMELSGQSKPIHVLEWTGSSMLMVSNQNLSTEFANAFFPL